MPDTITDMNLVDIRDVSVERSLSRKERLSDFERKLKDKHNYKCGRFKITAIFGDENAPSIEECLRGLYNGGN